MDIYINSVKADVTLQEEKTLADVLNAFEHECGQNAAAVIAVSADGQALNGKENDDLLCTAVDDVEKLEIETVTEDDIIRALREIGEKLSSLTDDMEHISVLLQSGKDAKASTVLTSFTDLFDVLCHVLSLCTLFPRRFAGFTIDGQNPADFLQDFSPVLSDFEKSLADSDTVLTGDLAEYEIVPRLRSFMSALHTFEDSPC